MSDINGSVIKSDINCIKVGSRKSELALVQTEFVISELLKLNLNLRFEIIKISTTGDKILNQALSKIGEKSLFTKELEVALEEKEVDFVVHSLKDLPTTLPDGMVIGAICEREDPSDALVFRQDLKGLSLSDLEPGSVVGTSSLRRVAQLRRHYPQLKFLSVRGNLNTRLKKLDQNGGDYSALVLAAAGLKRLNWHKRITQLIPASFCMHAVGQGALAVECRYDDLKTIEMLSVLCHKETTLRCVAERSFMKRLGGGCSVPIAVNTTLDRDNVLELTGGVFSLDGLKNIISSAEIDLSSNEGDNRSTKNIDGAGSTKELKILNIDGAGDRNMKELNLSIKDRAEDRSTKELHLSNKSGDNSTKELKISNTDGAGSTEKSNLSNEDGASERPIKKMKLSDKDTALPTIKLSLSNVDGASDRPIKKMKSSIEDGVSYGKKIEFSNDYCGVVANRMIEISLLCKADELGRNLADIFLEKGAKNILDEARAMNENSE